MNFSYTFDEILNLLKPVKVVGRTDVAIHAIKALREAGVGDISFLGNSKYQNEVAISKASVILLPEKFDAVPTQNQAFLFFANPSYALGELCRHIENVYNRKKQHAEIHSTSVISPHAQVGQNVSIGPNVVIEDDAIISDNVRIDAGCFIGQDVKIGKDSHLYPGVKIMHSCEIGERVTLFPGVVIGADGYGYETVNGVHEKVPQIGNVIIEDDVDIGANSTVDRARFGSTIIGNGTKVDNLVQIGHNVRIGHHCLIVSQTGISGSTTIGNYVVIGGQVGIAGHIEIPDGIMIAGKSSVASYHKKYGKILRGNPAEGINEMNRFLAVRKKLPDLVKRVDIMEKELQTKGDFN